MRKQINAILFAGGAVFLVFFIVVVINQTAGIVTSARGINPHLGNIVLYGLLLIYAAAAAVPIIIFLRMPPVLRPPEDIDSPDYADYLESVKKRLARNRHIVNKGVSVQNRDDIVDAIGVLNDKADSITKSTASTVFVTTAISQNGRLDAIMVLIAQIRLIWEIAHLFNQRPSLREMMNLYINVAATTFIAGGIEELDIEEQIEPIITPLISGSLFGGIPGAGGITTFMTTSIVDGAANALLTLRVGIITRRNFGIVHVSDRRQARRWASVEAGGMLAGIVVSSAGYITEAVLKASKKRAGAVGGTIKDAAVKSAGTVSAATKKTASTVVDYIKKGKK